MPSYDNAYLKLYLGPMFSGKSTKLIQLYNILNNIQNKLVLPVNYYLDTRYGVNVISSHDNNQISSVNTPLLCDLIEKQIYVDADIIIIDEGQFFPDILDFVNTSLQNKKHVYVFALNGDFKQKNIGQIHTLIPIMDDIELLKAICKKCKLRNALYSHKISGSDKQIDIGVSQYIPLCRMCKSI